jgi:CMP-N-acetylneuraminic acid synthetase
MWCFRIEDDTLRPFIDKEGLDKRSQDLPPAYVVTGSLYLIAPQDLRKRRSFIGDDAIPLVIETPQEGIDIDTEWDWQMAEMFLAAGRADCQ